MNNTPIQLVVPEVLLVLVNNVILGMMQGDYVHPQSLLTVNQILKTQQTYFRYVELQIQKEIDKDEKYIATNLSEFANTTGLSGTEGSDLEINRDDDKDTKI